jgi:hypothetical protein
VRGLLHRLGHVGLPVHILLFGLFC